MGTLDHQATTDVVLPRSGRRRPGSRRLLRGSGSGQPRSGNGDQPNTMQLSTSGVQRGKPAEWEGPNRPKQATTFGRGHSRGGGRLRGPNRVGNLATPGSPERAFVWRLSTRQPGEPDLQGEFYRYPEGNRQAC